MSAPLTTDTLVVSRHQLDSLTAANDYMASLHPYLEGSGRSLLDMLLESLEDILNDLVSGLFGSSAKPAWQVAALLSVIVCVVLLFLYRDRLKRLFRRGTKVEYAVGDDNIYDIDFETEIAQARAAGNNDLLVRLFYLKSLRVLADAGRIDWISGKTPSQFEREAQLPALSRLTPLFVRVRYGKYAASADDAALAEQCCIDVDSTLTDNVVEEGGEQA